jgi:hypothetical protein
MSSESNPRPLGDGCSNLKTQNSQLLVATARTEFSFSSRLTVSSMTGPTSWQADLAEIVALPEAGAPLADRGAMV